MNNLTIFITKIRLFVAAYKWLIIPIVPIVIFVYFIIIIISANQTKTATNLPNKKTTTVSQYPPQASTSPGSGISTSPAEQTNVNVTPAEDQEYTLDTEIRDIASGNITTANDESTLEKTYPNTANNAYPGDLIADGSNTQTVLPDGSIKYEYDSDDPNRPHMQIVKNGVVIFRRNLVSGAPLSDYVTFLNNPPYVVKGSAYYGPNAIIIANPPAGIAVVYNPDSNQVYEQYLFKAMSVADYIKTFGSDITNFNPAP